MLLYEPDQRLSASQALRHDWFDKFDDEEIQEELIQSCLLALSKFRQTNKLQEAVIVFLVGHVAPKKELENLKKVFIQFDTNGDGTLTRNELVRAWKQAFDE